MSGRRRDRNQEIEHVLRSILFAEPLICLHNRLGLITSSIHPLLQIFLGAQYPSHGLLDLTIAGAHAQQL